MEMIIIATKISSDNVFLFQKAILFIVQCPDSLHRFRKVLVFLFPVVTLFRLQGSLTLAPTLPSRYQVGEDEVDRKGREVKRIKVGSIPFHPTCRNCQHLRVVSS